MRTDAPHPAVIARSSQGDCETQNRDPTGRRLAPCQAALEYVPRDATDLMGRILLTLQQDRVALISGADETDADAILAEVASHFQLKDRLQMQAELANLYGERRRVTNYFMSVTNRDDYQFIKPHSEGSRSANMQMAALYCRENATDGGESVLFHTNQASRAWCDLRELVVRKAQGTRALSASEVAFAKLRSKLDPEVHTLLDDDLIGPSVASPIHDVELISALTRLRQQRSIILQKDVFTYWDTVSTIDLTSSEDYLKFLDELELVRRPERRLSLVDLDRSASRTAWRSGIHLHELFDGYLIHKLAPGELIIQNNLTWAHATANWTPGAGARVVYAAFA